MINGRHSEKPRSINKTKGRYRTKAQMTKPQLMGSHLHYI
jgi:hypothetical protein